VLDPFCGCGTTVHAAEKLGRQWIGIDVTHLAIGLIEKRLRDAFENVQFTSHGVPQDIEVARAIVSVKAGENISVQMIRDLRGVIEREKAEIGVLLTLNEPKKTMIAEAATAGQFTLEGFAPVPHLQIVTIEDALKLRDRAVQLPARRDDAFKRAAREDTSDSRQGKLI
jgi:site-specific DNA-methyltransferase (adenine-specific)